MSSVYIPWLCLGQDRLQRCPGRTETTRSHDSRQLLEKRTFLANLTQLYMDAATTTPADTVTCDLSEAVAGDECGARHK